MPHLIFSCLESRVEDNGVLFGRYLLGPLRIGQATTIATALRRGLLSEVRGICITAVEIVGASHQYSSIKGVRESALDIILNLKEIVLRGTPVHDLPSIGYIDIQGPRIVTANDLILPNGICCVNSNKLIATLSANGLLKIKFVISAGKSSLTPYTKSLSESVFQPKTRLQYHREKLKNNLVTSSLYHGKVKQGNVRKRNFSLISKLHQTAWGRENNIILYNKKRRPMGGTINVTEAKELNASTSARGLTISSSSLKKGFLEVKNVRTPDETSRPVFFEKSVGTFTHNLLSEDTKKSEKVRSVLPVDPIFAPITRVNFAIQIDEQWQEPRERIVLEIWSNGSIHPRQAIHEAATNLVYLFSLLR